VRLGRYLLPRLYAWGSYALFGSCRISYVDKHHEDQFLQRGLPILFAGLHQGLLYFPYHFRDRDGVVMVSASRDGDLIADTMARFGLRAARGSSTRLGQQALAAMITEINERRCSGGIIVDGPRGPAAIAKPGVIALARATGLPIVPGCWWARPSVRFRSWDQTLIPLPFARLVFAFEEPILVPRDGPDDSLALSVELTRRLQRARDAARARCGG